ncbi:MAG: hypothetical protein UY52_C0016G0057 [Parcubacteria group bacterium GW2011_GWC2_49_9]|nr:MAG: hypothetical protein UY34_C0031G0004 [Parcubacteria group bacterium GW2011_GWA2_48_9]KKW15680.1 MAG: hypothetical protein UY52_C0016G0057 [Parcubacteria group bacterium GW2011_GWC2_49_9]
MDNQERQQQIGIHTGLSTSVKVAISVVIAGAVVAGVALALLMTKTVGS